MIDAWWFTGPNNFGDELNPYLIEKISGSKPNFSTKNKHLCIGSIIHTASDGDIVWGSGHINNKNKLEGKPKIHAVRGPKTRQRLIDEGIDCPEVYGDPALLLPRYFNPSVKKTHKYGIVPHYIDKPHCWVQEASKREDTKIIDIQQDIETVIKDILSCEIIFSSSLHGIIAGDAYGIPSYWIKFNNRLGDFKFEDYFMSVGRECESTFILNQALEDIATPDYKINIDLDKLYGSCPFTSPDLSILICTIPSRTRSMIKLLYSLEKQTRESVEILYLGDNKKMSVGEKRNKLLEMASGKYVIFIDDDDRIAEDYVDEILSKVHEGSDVITFDVEISENGSEYKKVYYDVTYKCDKNLPNSYERMPNHLMAIKRELAVKAKFPEKSFAEDHEYALRLKSLLESESKVNKTLYYYDFDSSTSETRS